MASIKHYDFIFEYGVTGTFCQDSVSSSVGLVPSVSVNISYSCDRDQAQPKVSGRNCVGEDKAKTFASYVVPLPARMHWYDFSSGF